MDDRRIKAYRRLLYHATLDILQLLWIRLRNPMRWGSCLRQMRRAGATADWMHNLGLFSSLDFEGFKEDWFWLEFDGFARRYPEMECYRRRFEQDLLEPLC